MSQARVDPTALLDQRYRMYAISAVCSESCTMFTACGLLLQLRNCHIDPFLAFRFVLAQLISWFSSTANGSGNICQLSRGKGKGALCRERLLCVDGRGYDTAIGVAGCHWR